MKAVSERQGEREGREGGSQRGPGSGSGPWRVASAWSQESSGVEVMLQSYPDLGPGDG